MKFTPTYSKINILSYLLQTGFLKINSSFVFYLFYKCH